MQEKEIGQAQIKKWTELHPEEAKAARLKGSEKGNKIKSEKATFKKLLKTALEMKDDSGLTNKEKMVYAIIEKAINGDNKSFEIVRDTVGETIAQQIEVGTKNTINIRIDGDKPESE